MNPSSLPTSHLIRFPQILFCLLASFFLQTGAIAQKDFDTHQVDPALILAWNELAYTIAYEHDQFTTLVGIRTLTMLHLVIHDVLNVIDPHYRTYQKILVSEGKVCAIAAISEAANEILMDAYPARKDTILKTHNALMEQANKGNSRELGRALGKKIARKMMQIREGDGHKKQGNYTPMSKPGAYQYTPGFENFVFKPDFNYARPFAMDSVTQFRSPEPPSMASAVYTQSFEEVKKYGMKKSLFRTIDETNYGHWWAEFGEHSWNRLGRILTKDKEMDAWEAARMFALLNMDIYEIYLASLESKYHYDTWRPITAIRNAATDANPNTEADKEWEPEMLTPPWPEYPSAHAAVGAGGAQILSHIFGTSKVSFSMESVTALPESKTRAYDDLKKAADDCANSRIMNGYHFRFATEEGKRQGQMIAQFILLNYLEPLPEGD